MANQITCEQFTDILIRRTPHYDTDLLKDVTPVNGWVGQVPTGDWPAFEGVSKIGHRVRRMFPDLSGCWTTVVAEGCVGTPCDPIRKKVGFGFDQFAYNLEEIFYETDIFCFPLVMSADAAKEQFAALISGLREATIWIWNHRFRTEALRLAKRKVVAGQALDTTTVTNNADCTVLTTTAEPTSKLTIQFLQRYVDILTLEGYLGENPLPASMMFELVTDIITSNKLSEDNPALQNFLRVSTPEEFGRLYRYGLTKGIGNFLIRHDPTPLRYQRVSENVFNVLFPYENNAATGGIGGDVNIPYVEGRYQVDFIWHRGVMRSLLRRSAPINGQMPFMARDYGGRWKFVMDNMTCRDDSGTIIPVNNEERTKGKFIANFSAGTRPEHTEWAVAILSLRELSCVVDDYPCNDAYPYVSQDYSSTNDPCPNPDFDFDLTDCADGESYVVNGVTCNSVAQDGDGSLPSAAQATVADVVNFLNTNFSYLGTWSNPEGTTLRLAGSTCGSVDVDITCEA